MPLPPQMCNALAQQHLPLTDFADTVPLSVQERRFPPPATVLAYSFATNAPAEAEEKSRSAEQINPEVSWKSLHIFVAAVIVFCQKPPN